MSGIDLLIEEHKYISRMLVIMRKACLKLKTHDLSDCIIYSSCEPCPMCLSAIIWSNIKVMYFGATRYDAAAAGFRDDVIYRYLNGENNILEKHEVTNKECVDVLKNYEGEIY